jgi:formate-dependent nitrite reductase cytochrome c552 subunit
MTFRHIFVSIILATAMVVAAFVVHGVRPDLETAQPGPEYIRATGKCAECHRRETSAIVHQFSMSKHAQQNVTCYDCHRVQTGQDQVDHKGFTLAKNLTAFNCSQCHSTEYAQFLRSRHGAPAWAAVTGWKDFNPEQIAYAEQYHPGSVKRPVNALAVAEGMGVMEKGCMACHSVGKPNVDGSIGTCTACHARHSTSVALARQPATCGQCHMGPDHSQLEIFEESKHGVLFASQKEHFNLNASPKTLTTRDMPVPTCATCHMSGLEGMNVTIIWDKRP